jgi:hypothetical protein
LRVEYPRVARARSPGEISIDCAARGTALQIWMSRAYLGDFEIDEVRPAPAEVSADEQRTYFTFRTRDPAARAHVDFTLRPRRAGTLRGSVGCDDVSVDVRQFIFP